MPVCQSLYLFCSVLAGRQTDRERAREIEREREREVERERERDREIDRQTCSGLCISLDRQRETGRQTDSLVPVCLSVCLGLLFCLSGWLSVFTKKEYKGIYGISCRGPSGGGCAPPEPPLQLGEGLRPFPEPLPV